MITHLPRFKVETTPATVGFAGEVAFDFPEKESSTKQPQKQSSSVSCNSLLVCYGQSSKHRNLDTEGNR